METLEALIIERAVKKAREDVQAQIDAITPLLRKLFPYGTMWQTDSLPDTLSGYWENIKEEAIKHHEENARKTAIPEFVKKIENPVATGWESMKCAEALKWFQDFEASNRPFEILAQFARGDFIDTSRTGQ